jgi:hypothetical protein
MALYRLDATQEEVEEPIVPPSPPEESLNGNDQSSTSHQDTVIRALFHALLVQTQGKMDSASPTPTLLQEILDYSDPSIQHPDSTSLPGNQVEVIPSQSNWRSGRRFQVSEAMIREVIATEKARLVESIMQHSQSALSSTVGAQDQQKVSRENEEATPPSVHRTGGIGSQSRDQRSSNNGKVAKSTRINQSKAVAATARGAGQTESFPEVSLASSSG